MLAVLPAVALDDAIKPGLNPTASDRNPLAKQGLWIHRVVKFVPVHPHNRIVGKQLLWGEGVGVGPG